MTFDLVRMGWPNTAAILALAAVPVLALMAQPSQQQTSSQLEHSPTAAICLTMAECPAFAAAAPQEITLD